MLSLVVNNKEKRVATCQTACEIYDPKTNQCGYWKNREVTNPSVFFSCHKKVTSNSFQKNSQLWVNHMEEAAPSVIAEWQGAKENEAYPFSPDISSQREDAYWYTSPDETFGCWVVNNSKNTVSLAITGEKREYSSVVPLHDHEAPSTLASRMCWYVDQNGIGRYTMLDNGKVIRLSI
ncbi:hypothetical protein ACFVAD_20475 [Sutcliffiella sp. NPDC057660]|uniref:hypothetical protein n=1 Tax=Sutcliffiella sp. NPDC057660 TaxID=3346199 RepID=UPI00368B8121